MNEHMEGRAPWVPWAVTSVALLAVAAVAYYLGVRNGELMGAAGGEGARLWHRHGHGFGFGGLWMFFVMFWVFAGLRRLWWGPRYYGWHRRGPYRACYDDRDAWEEWHRQAHRSPDAPREGGSGGDSRPR